MRVAVLSAAFVLMTAMAANASVQDAHKICIERYNTEKAGGTIPVGMSRATYINQCTGSIRRAAKLEQELAQQAAAPAEQSGSNEVVVAPRTARPVATTHKPTRVKTTLSITQAPSGN
jgi:hypothetical protein